MISINDKRENATNASFETTNIVASRIRLCDSTQRTQTIRGKIMAIRKQFAGNVKAAPELVALMESSRAIVVTEDMLREQRVSFAFGNAMNAERITKDSVRTTSKSIRLRA